MVQYSHIWFDLGLTLVGTSRAADYAAVLNKFGIHKSEQEIEIAYHMTDKLFMREYKGLLGKDKSLFMPWYLGVLNYNLDVQLNLYEEYSAIREFKDNQNFSWRTFGFTVETIMKLKNIGLKVGLISNWDKGCRQVLSANNILELFDTVVISAEVGYEKPSEKIFRYALEQAKALPETSLYVGDNYYDDVLGSSRVGMQCLLINPYGRKGIEELDYEYVIRDIREIFNYLDKNNSRLEVS